MGRAAITGAARLKSTLAAAERGAIVALANKETLVCAGGHVSAAPPHQGHCSSGDSSITPCSGDERKPSKTFIASFDRSRARFAQLASKPSGRDRRAGAQASQLVMGPK